MTYYVRLLLVPAKIFHCIQNILNWKYKLASDSDRADYFATPEKGNLLLSCELRAGAQSECWADFDKQSWQITGSALILAIKKFLDHNLRIRGLA